MKSLKNKVITDNAKAIKEFSHTLATYMTIPEILEKWYYTQLLTQTTKNKNWSDITELIKYLNQRYNKKINKKLKENIQHIETVKKCNREIVEIIISIDWKKSRTWGFNPTANIKIYFSDNTMEYFESPSVSGCGYDKESMAVSIALNKSNDILKILYIKKNKNIEQENKNIIGYGSGYGLLPRFEGGVGIESFRHIFENLNFRFNTVTKGKHFDVYKVQKNK